MSKADLRPDPQILVDDEWWYFEEPRWLHLVHRIPGQPGVTYTIAIPWAKIRASLERHDRPASKKKTRGK